MFQLTIIKTEDRIRIRIQQHNWMRIQIRFCNPALYGTYLPIILHAFLYLKHCPAATLSSLPIFPI